MPYKDPGVRSAYLKAWRAANKDKTAAYGAKPRARTKQRILSTKYAAMKCRCAGKQMTAQRYAGLPVLPKDEFISWAITHPEFNRLYQAWEVAGYAQSCAPSIDRIDSSKGYLLPNMQWLTLAENVAKATKGKRHAN